MIVLGISSHYHDSSACIIKDGIIVAAAQEERFTRIKHDNGFPVKSIDYCLRSLGIAANEVDAFSFYEKPILKFERLNAQHVNYFPKSLKTYINSTSSWYTEKLRIPKLLEKHFHYHGKVLYVPHHMSHAAGTYYLSDFSDAVIVTIDGVGEWATTTVGYGDKTGLKIDKEIHFPHSLGLLYSAFTYFLGFKVNSAEYKVMGLAAYGNKEKFRSKMNNVISLNSDGSFRLNMDYFDYGWNDVMTGGKLEKLFGIKRRVPESELKPRHVDIAAALQDKLESAVFNLLNAAHKKYKIDNLCFSGGVALNSVLNGKILINTPFRNIYIPPDPGDGGGAMGAAFVADKYISGKTGKYSFTPYLGPQFSDEKIKTELLKNGLKYNYFLNEKDLLKKTAELLTAKKVVGWFQGKMEWGPRALGSRSILADARSAGMKKILNIKVKKREEFRPFAPVILEKEVHKYFKGYSEGIKELGKYMLVVLPFVMTGAKKVPATVHVDGTGRLQSLEKKDNPLYYSLIEEYKKITGVPVIINTSFNIRGEPIVCTPGDAVKCFLNTGIDVLVIGNYIVEK